MLICRFRFNIFRRLKYNTQVMWIVYDTLSFLYSLDKTKSRSIVLFKTNYPFWSHISVFKWDVVPPESTIKSFTLLMVQFHSIRDWQVKADWLLISGQDDGRINEPIALKTRSSGINRRGGLRVDQRIWSPLSFPPLAPREWRLIVENPQDSRGFECASPHIKLLLLQEKTWTFYWIHSSERKAWHYGFGLKVSHFFSLKSFTHRN